MKRLELFRNSICIHFPYLVFGFKRRTACDDMLVALYQSVVRLQYSDAWIGIAATWLVRMFTWGRYRWNINVDWYWRKIVGAVEHFIEIWKPSEIIRQKMTSWRIRRGNAWIKGYHWRENKTKPYGVSCLIETGAEHREQYISATRWRQTKSVRVPCWRNKIWYQ